ncbi:hypothetical protein CerSpe_211080 [Prunus speciosa]
MPKPNPEAPTPTPTTHERLSSAASSAPWSPSLSLSAASFLVVWLILRPKVPDFQVDSLSLSNFNVCSALQSMTGTWSVGFIVYNPNKKLSIRYDDVESSIYYSPCFISETRVPPFAQGTKDRTSVNATFSAANSFVGAPVARDIDVDRARGRVSFNVKLLARVEFRRGGWRLRRRLLRVLCHGVSVSLSSKGELGTLAGWVKRLPGCCLRWGQCVWCKW